MLLGEAPILHDLVSLSTTYTRLVERVSHTRGSSGSSLGWGTRGIPSSVVFNVGAPSFSLFDPDIDIFSGSAVALVLISDMFFSIAKLELEPRNECCFGTL